MVQKDSGGTWQILRQQKLRGVDMKWHRTRDNGQLFVSLLTHPIMEMKGSSVLPIDIVWTDLLFVHVDKLFDAKETLLVTTIFVVAYNNWTIDVWSVILIVPVEELSVGREILPDIYVFAKLYDL